ncbi:MAG: nicotinate-nucleotide adenylyltransferase [Prevotella sp.]|nr:nicotinate-nucleotide adenylyltransferase [Prevotella sp.]
MVKTGIYGGSFNPIHNGHIALARQFLSSVGLDEVWFIVSPQNPFKVNETLLDDQKRFQLVQLALKKERKMKASDYEFHLPKPSYMWNTLQHLSEDYPQREFILLIGGDNWTRFNCWYHAEDILRNYRIVVYPRKNEPIDSHQLPQNVELIDAELLNISSTDIRQRIARGLPISDYVPCEVATQIQKEHLYENLTKRL